MKQYQTWTPRVRRLIYDSLVQDTGCQAIKGNDVFGSRAFQQICTFNHNAAAEVFNRDPRIAYATGPLNTGLLPPWSTRWAVWLASRGARVAKIPAITLPSDSLGAPSSFFNPVTPLPAKVTCGFTSLGLLGIAIQYDTTNIQIKWFKDADGTYGDETFPGVQPVLFGNSLVYTSSIPGANDLVLYYLRSAAPNTIFARFEREGFLAEHAVNANLPVNVTKLIASEASGKQQLLFGRDALGRDVTLTSPVYIVSLATEKTTLGLSIVKGVYRQSAVSVNIPFTNNKATLKIGVAGGAYSDVIVKPTASLSGDAGTLTLSIETGSYD